MSVTDNISQWPLVVEGDDGIRPAGPKDACFYCGQKIGTPHGKECVIVTKIVKIRFCIEIPVQVPHSWDQRMIDFRYNESSWCASNLIEDLKDFDEKHGCLCPVTEAKYIETIDNTPTRKVR